MKQFVNDYYSQWVHAVYNLLYCEDWNVGLVRAPIQKFLDPDFKPAIEWWPRKSGTFSADPFGMRVNGQSYVFFEEFIYPKLKGRIMARRLVDGKQDGLFQVLDFPFHLSYPFMIENEGQVYCIPESFSAREIALYRAVDFPRVWEKDVVLIPDYAGVDSTLFQYEGQWWLFGTDQKDQDCAKLKIWHSPALKGTWTPHQGNPVKTDIGSSRSAGTPFWHEGRLYRPAMDCSKKYGGGLVINRIEKLSPTAFEEVCVRKLSPDPAGRYRDGIHTLSTCGEFTLVDGNKRTFVGLTFYGMLYNFKYRKQLMQSPWGWPQTPK